IGAAAFGAVLANRLAVHLVEQLGPIAAAMQEAKQINTSNIAAIQELPEPIKSSVLVAFTRALDDVFLFGVPIVAVALVVALFLKEVPLRTGARRPAGEPATAEALSAGL